MEKGNKKTLVILLLAPFLVGLLTYVSVTVLKNTIGVDISDIRWEYNENEGFRLANDPYPLKASAVYDTSAVLSSGNDLVWQVENSDGASSPHASIETLATGSYALKTLTLGSVKLTCRNEKGSKSKHFNADIYDQGYIRVNAALPNSGSSSSTLRSYGQYDMLYTSLAAPLGKTNAKIPLTIEGDYDGSAAAVTPLSLSDNVHYDAGVIEVLSPGEAQLTFALTDHPFVTKSYSFIALENTYNVYSYDDLLKGTNYSAEGEALCLQKNFDSLKNTYQQENGVYVDHLQNEATALFGHFRFHQARAAISPQDVYRFPTTSYSHSLISTPIMPPCSGANVSSDVLAGLHVQKSLYGNGFLINMHELMLSHPRQRWAPMAFAIPRSQRIYFFGPLAAW
jgi:hypothetical protein